MSSANPIQDTMSVQLTHSETIASENAKVTLFVQTELAAGERANDVLMGILNGFWANPEGNDAGRWTLTNINTSQSMGRTYVSAQAIVRVPFDVAAQMPIKIKAAEKAGLTISNPSIDYTPSAKQYREAEIKARQGLRKMAVAELALVKHDMNDNGWRISQIGFGGQQVPLRSSVMSNTVYAMSATASMNGPTDDEVHQELQSSFKVSVTANITFSRLAWTPATDSWRPSMAAE